MRDRRYLAGRNETLFVDRFDNENYFAADLHEGGITVLAHDDNINTDEDPDDPLGIDLETASSRG